MKSGNGMAGTGTSPWRCWPTPAWRWSGARRWNKEVREKRGLSQLGRKTDTPDGARGPAVALPADMETSTYGRISAAVVPVETAAPGNGPALPLPTPPETPHHISATVVLEGIDPADVDMEALADVVACQVSLVASVNALVTSMPEPALAEKHVSESGDDIGAFEVMLAATWPLVLVYLGDIRKSGGKPTVMDIAAKVGIPSAVVPLLMPLLTKKLEEFLRS